MVMAASGIRTVLAVLSLTVYIAIVGKRVLMSI